MKTNGWKQRNVLQSDTENRKEFGKGKLRLYVFESLLQQDRGKRQCLRLEGVHGAYYSTSPLSLPKIQLSKDNFGTEPKMNW